MQHPFSVLRDEYTALLTHVQFTRQKEVDFVVRHRVHPPSLLRAIDEHRYVEGCAATGVPVPWAAASFEREASSNFNLSPAQGDPLNRVSWHVPRGLGPYPRPGRAGSAWAQAQEDAYRIDHLDQIGAASWTIERACYEGEIFNGFGPRNHGRHTGYLWAGTTVYMGGKYVADGVWSASAIDQQLGIVPLMLRIVQLRPELAFANQVPPIIGTNQPPPPPQVVPVGYHDAYDLQRVLNTLHVEPKLDVDGNYGRHTTANVRSFQALAHLTVDGIAGPATWAAIDMHLVQLHATLRYTGRGEPEE